MELNFIELLKKLLDLGGSDLHLTVGIPPAVRVDGAIQQLDEFPALTSKDTRTLIYSVMTDAQKHKFEEEHEMDFSFGIKGLSRFRANVFMQKGAVAGVFRVIPYKILTFEQLGLPQVVRDLTKKPNGLILVTGPTGSGKSTTLATMIDTINQERKEHIITIEDPIEFVHNHKMCVVNQREVFADTKSFSNALKYSLRQDPDVVLVGELRDLETIETALRVAETGHLVFATLHTNSAIQTINRIIDVFPPHQQQQVRTQLSFVLEGVLCQTLLRKASGKGRVMAMEILIPTPAIRNLIREDKLHQIYSQMQLGQSTHGMQTLNQSLFNHYTSGAITLDAAIEKSTNPDELIQMFQKAGIQVNKALYK
jgi:twitching motility protein PilT